MLALSARNWRSELTKLRSPLDLCLPAIASKFISPRSPRRPLPIAHMKPPVSSSMSAAIWSTLSSLNSPTIERSIVSIPARRSLSTRSRARSATCSGVRSASSIISHLTSLFTRAALPITEQQPNAITIARTMLNNFVDCFIKFYLHIFSTPIQKYACVNKVKNAKPQSRTECGKNIFVAQSPFHRFPNSGKAEGIDKLTVGRIKSAQRRIAQSA